IYPTHLEQEILNKIFGCCRLLWNQMLAERNNIYQQLKEDFEALRTHKYKTEKEYAF
ncbi:MAG: helix-turn-helix domain-containing protein, partial [Candidatus Lokiarchaeota archaeon]|nr:helix-turn-helix domain-containing protein [Candidatus Lokiarchaeota archaeon]